MKDLIGLAHAGICDPCIKVLDHGFVKLVDCLPRLVYNDAIETCDFAIIQAARISTGLGIKIPEEDRNLIRYLMRHRHTSPFEQVEFKFHCAMPIFVARQWVRHRMASLNEFSGRYAEMPDVFYIPDEEKVRQQSNLNKQGGEVQVDAVIAKEFLHGLRNRCDDLYKNYKETLDSGIARELARVGLPINLYTQWYWKIDLKNLLDFLALRCDTHAQYEIRVFAEAILQLIAPMVPVTIEAWNDYNPLRSAVILTALEIQMLAFEQGHSKVKVAMSSRELQEWKEKKIRLGLA